MKEKISEEELCKRFIAAFPKPDGLYFEVECYGGIADMVFVERPVTIIYEAKNSFGIKLLLQCIDRRHAANYVVAVVPGGSYDYATAKLFQDYGIGVVEVHKTERYKKESIFTLHEKLAPKLFRATYPIKVEAFHKENSPGTQHGRVTAFGNMINTVVENLKSAKGNTMSLNDALNCQGYYKTLKQFKGNIYQWCRTGVIKEFYLERGFLILGQPKTAEEVVPVLQPQMF